MIPIALNSEIMFDAKINDLFPLAIEQVPLHNRSLCKKSIAHAVEGGVVANNIGVPGHKPQRSKMKGILSY